MRRSLCTAHAPDTQEHNVSTYGAYVRNRDGSDSTVPSSRFGICRLCRYICINNHIGETAIQGDVLFDGAEYKVFSGERWLVTVLSWNWGVT